MEEEDKILKAEDLVKQFGLYDVKLDLPCYQYPTLAMFPKEIQRILIEFRDSNDENEHLQLLEFKRPHNITNSEINSCNN